MSANGFADGVEGAVRIEMLGVNCSGCQVPIFVAPTITPECVSLGGGLKRGGFLFYKGIGAKRYQTPEEVSTADDAITGVWYRYAPPGIAIILR